MASKVGSVGIFSCVKRWDEWRDYFPALESKMYEKCGAEHTVDVTPSLASCCERVSNVVGHGTLQQELTLEVGEIGDCNQTMDYSPRLDIDDSAWGNCDSDGLPWDYYSE